jgi:nitrogen regulatory protein PII
MKRIEAVIAYDSIQAVEKALIRSGIEGLTLTSVSSHGTRATARTMSFRDRFSGTPSCKLDVLVSDRELSTVLTALMPFVDQGTWMPICVMDLEVTIRIRTGESEEAALR